MLDVMSVIRTTLSFKLSLCSSNMRGEEPVRDEITGEEDEEETKHNGEDDDGDGDEEVDEEEAVDDDGDEVEDEQVTEHGSLSVASLEADSGGAAAKNEEN